MSIGLLAWCCCPPYPCWCWWCTGISIGDIIGLTRGVTLSDVWLLPLLPPLPLPLPLPLPGMSDAFLTPTREGAVPTARPSSSLTR
jgi:hypothetical protein